MKINIKDSWPKTLTKLKSIVELEIRERRTTIQRANQSGREKYLENFIEMASDIVYVVCLIYGNVCLINVFLVIVRYFGILVVTPTSRSWRSL